MDQVKSYKRRLQKKNYFNGQYKFIPGLLRDRWAARAESSSHWGVQGGVGRRGTNLMLMRRGWGSGEFDVSSNNSPDVRGLRILMPLSSVRGQ